MIKEFGSLTPEDVLRKLDLIVEKPKPDFLLVDTSKNNLPFPDYLKEEMNLVGYGDWAKGRSSGGSAVLANSDLVVKIPLGKLATSKKPLVLAKERQETAEKFSETSPKTLFFIARIDGENAEQKVIAVQKKNKGTPAYKTYFNELLSPGVTAGMQNVLNNMREVLKSDSILDGVGLHLDNSTLIKRTIIRVMCSIPWFSDNVMVEGNKVSLVDNTPEIGVHTMNNSFKRKINLLRLDFSKGVVSVASKLYSKFQSPQSDLDLAVKKSV